MRRPRLELTACRPAQGRPRWAVPGRPRPRRAAAARGRLPRRADHGRLPQPAGHGRLPRAAAERAAARGRQPLLRRAASPRPVPLRSPRLAPRGLDAPRRPGRLQYSAPSADAPGQASSIPSRRMALTSPGWDGMPRARAARERSSSSATAIRVTDSAARQAASIAVQSHRACLACRPGSRCAVRLAPA